VPAERWHPFDVGARDLEAMCHEYEATIKRAGGLDLVMLGLGPNAHIASNEPGSELDSSTRPVRLTPETVSYILTDDVLQGAVSDRAVTLGIGTILAAREVVLLVSGRAKRAPLGRLLEGAVDATIPASALHLHPRCTILADEEAHP
jgi:glucosamine-6-phosphate deaminase